MEKGYPTNGLKKDKKPQQLSEDFTKPVERARFKAYGAKKRSAHVVHEHFEYRATQKIACAGGFAKPSISEKELDTTMTHIKQKAKIKPAKNHPWRQLGGNTENIRIKADILALG